MTLSDTVRIANQFADREERALAALEPFTALGIRWQVVDGEPSPIDAEWTGEWRELLGEAQITDWDVERAIYRSILSMRNEPQAGDPVEPDLAETVLNFWRDYLVEQMERAA